MRFCTMLRSPAPVSASSTSSHLRAPTALQNCFFGQRLTAQRVTVPGFPKARQSISFPGRGSVLVEANAKRCLGDTTYGTRRKRTRTSGFRTRKLTVGGRKVLRSRRQKGRKVLCPANSNRGVKSTAASNRR